MGRVSLRDLLGRAVRCLVLLIALSGILPATSWAEPLRIWVMHNEPLEFDGPITAPNVEESIERLRSRGIIIENSVKNLMMPAETKSPLAAYVLKGNQLFEEIESYRRSSGDTEPIAVEFIRWEDAYSRIMGALTSDDVTGAPDIAQVGHSWAVALGNMNRLARGNLNTVPWFAEIRLLYYNKEMVDDPSKLADWKGFLSLAESFDMSGGKRFMAFPTAISWNLLHNLVPWLWGGGGDLIRAKQIGPMEFHSVALDEPESMSGIMYLRELAESGSVDFPPVTQEILDRDFRDGKYAAIITGPWIVKILGEEWHGRLGAGPLPAGPGGSHPFVGGSHLIVSRASEERGNFERATSFVRHLTSPSSQLSYAKATGFYPVNKEALEHILKDAEGDLFRNSVKSALSYPEFSDWGDVVENEFIRGDVWHIWRDIAQGVSDDALANTVLNAASELKTELMLSTARRYAPIAGIALIAIGILWAILLMHSRHRYMNALIHFENKVAELRRISAERAILEGKALFLQRRSEEQTEALIKLKDELSALRNRSESIRQELGIGRFSIAFDGTTSIAGEEIHFDNNRQAKHLIEHIVRWASRGVTEVHYLWGYALFGWDRESIRSQPRRLFETTVAKINGRLRRLRMPPLLKRTGRKSPTWKLLWDCETTIENSDTHRSAEEYDAAARQFSDGDIDGACAHLVRAAELDPKNLEALELVSRIVSCGTCPEKYAGRMGSILKMGEHLLRKEVDMLDHGIAQIERIEEAGELQSMKDHAEYIRDRMDGIFGEEAEFGKSLMLGDIMNQLHRVREDISRLRSSKETVDHLWAQVVDSRNFTRLLAIPRIQAMVNNFYNEDIQAREDPRLVQLALISMLSRPSTFSRASSAKDEHELLSLINRGLKKQLISLEDELGSLS